MAKARSEYVCTDCGASHNKWAGRCSDCGAWNCLVEQRVEASPGRGARSGFAGAAGAVEVTSLDKVKAVVEERHKSGIGELDRVLGGGLVTGSVVLIGGDPGIGKSTLLLQMSGALGGRMSTLYVSGEESLQQLSMRAQRLGLDKKTIRCFAETSIDTILGTAEKEKPGVLIVDSIQTIYSEDLQSAPGAVAQVRETAARLVRYAKATGTAVFLVGHVTKEGAIAGPRVLEHMVDAVLYFEGESAGRYRMIRAVKNRFGAVNEIGVFAMSERGLKEINNPSAIFLSGSEEARPGSAITVSREGTRPLMVEVQALADPSHLSNPRRVAVGFDGQRLNMLLAVLHRQGGVAAHDQDVFVNVVGGMRISETATDLPLVLAICSSLRNQPLPESTVIFGELGLSGEIRPVYNADERLKEAASHGFKSAIVPLANVPKRDTLHGIKLHRVERLDQAVEIIRG